MHADIDGDGRRDTVRLYDTGKKGDNRIWKVKATTAAGHTSWVTVKIPSYQSLTGFYGWAYLDGTRGAEVILSPLADDFDVFIVLNWRGGALHRELAPGGYKEWSAATEIDASGYRFFTAASGKRYVNDWFATCPGQPDKPGTCTVKTVRYVWRGGAWHKSATLPKTKVANTEIYARGPLGALKIHH
jgi:hypothetical protein